MAMNQADEKEIGLNDKYLRIWGVPLISLSGLLSLMQFFFHDRWDLFWKYLLASFVYTWVTWELCRIVLIRIRRRIPELQQTVKRLLLTMFFFLVIAGLGNAVVKVILYHLGLKPPSMLNKSFFEWWLLNMPNIVFFVILLSSIYESIYFFSQYKQTIQKAKQLKKQQAQQRLDTLKSRVNPHFLFNSLTTLSALISEDASRAEQFVDELSKVYRYLLRAGRQTLASLAEELQFAESYVFLLKNRFEVGAFTFSNDTPKDLDPSQPLSIPVLTFQNSLDYLVRTQNVPLHIRVASIDQHLQISCKNHPKALSFDANTSDWSQLAAQQATKQTLEGTLTIQIPFTFNATTQT
jgi:hypothetical protein